MTALSFLAPQSRCVLELKLRVQEASRSAGLRDSIHPKLNFVNYIASAGWGERLR